MFRRCQSAVIRSENHDRVLVQRFRFQRRPQLADAVVQRLDHRGIHRIRLNNPAGDPLILFLHDRKRIADLKRILLIQSHPLRFFFKVGDIFRLGLQRRMHRIVPEVQEKWTLTVAAADQGGRFRADPVGQVFPFRPLAEVFHVVWTEISFLRMAPPAAPEVDIKTVMLRIRRFFSQMPFSDMPGLITGFLKRFRHRELTDRQLLDIWRID